MSSLSEASQVHIAIAVCLASSTTIAPSALCRRYVSNFSALTRALDAPTTAAMSSQTLPLVIMHLGSVVGIGHVAMKAAFATVLQSMPSAQLRVLEMHSFVPGGSLSSVETAATTSLGARCQVWSDYEPLARLCRERGSAWGESKACIMVLVNWDGLQAALDAVGGDSSVGDMSSAISVSSHIKAFQTAMHGLQPHVPVNNMAVLSFFRAVDAPDDVACLTGMFGTPQTLCPEQYGVPQHPWTVHSSPVLDKVYGLSEAVSETLSLDGWSWPCDRKVSGCRMPSKITEELMQLIDVQLFRERELDPAEHEQYSLMQMSHSELGARRLLSRSLLLAMLGLKDLPLAEVLEEALPCLRRILSTTGQALPDGAVGGQECGLHRWCLNSSYRMV